MPSEKSEVKKQIALLNERIAELEEIIEERDDQLFAAEKMVLLGQLMAGIAHEINTPLGALRSNFDLFVRYHDKLRRLLADSDSRDTLQNDTGLQKMFDNIEKLNEVNKNAGERIVNIVNSVRRYARQDADDISDADLGELVDSTLTLLHHEIKNRIDIHREYEPIGPVRCYPNQLNQVFLNLLVNACQAIDGKGNIEIRIFKADREAVVEIADDGKGIEEEHLNRIFEAGFTTKEHGMGMGLMLVRKMIDKHRGRIEVESELKKGTRFRIYLPIG